MFCEVLCSVLLNFGRELFKCSWKSLEHVTTCDASPSLQIEHFHILSCLDADAHNTPAVSKETASNIAWNCSGHFCMALQVPLGGC